VWCCYETETTLRTAKDDVTGVDEALADRAAVDVRSAGERVSCILCMERIGSTGQLQQHLLMVGIA